MSKLEIKKTPDLPAPPCCMYHKYVINFVIFFPLYFKWCFFYFQIQNKVKVSLHKNGSRKCKRYIHYTINMFIHEIAKQLAHSFKSYSKEIAWYFTYKRKIYLIHSFESTKWQRRQLLITVYIYGSFNVASILNILHNFNLHA